MGKVHLELDELSAFADSELDEAQSQAVRQHLGACPRCSAELAALMRLDGVLASTPIVSCAGSLDLRSALVDGQLTAQEAAIAREHIAGCHACAGEEVAWLAADLALRSLPAGLPSARVDAAIRALTERRPRRAIFPVPSGLVPAAGLRLGLAAILVFGIVAGLIPGQAPEQARPAEPDAVLVSAAQQIVLYQPTNTFYVLQQPQAAVDAVDATTNVPRARIVVGGKPTALALDAFAGRILVLDSSRKSLIEIDPQVDQVVRTTPVDVAGTPTSIRVASDGKVVVAASRPSEPSARSGPRPTPSGSAGEVAVLDTQRKLETVRSVAVAPRQIVTDPEGKGALFVSESATTVVDSSYQAQRTLPGGVGAAYGATGWIAVLGGSGTDAVLHLIGDGAPRPLRLTGIPVAITSMPEGGFAVLLGSGSGNGRIVVIDAAGAAIGVTTVDDVGRDLMYDPATRRFAVVNGGNVVSAALPLGIVARDPELLESPAPSVAPAVPSSRPNASEAPVSPSPIVSPAPRVSPPASPRASAPVAVASPSLPPGVPQSAQRISDSIYRVPLGGRMPILTTSSPTHMWFLDQDNVMNAVDLSTGEHRGVAALPKEAMISAIVATRSYVFALDPILGTIYIVDALTGRASGDSIALFRGATGLTTDGGSQVWIASGSSPELFSMEAETRRLEVYDVGMEAQIVTFDGGRGVWFSDGDKRIGFYDFRTGLATELALGSEGSARSLLPDLSGTLWVGTTAGEVIAVRERTKVTVARAGRAIFALALDPDGMPWYLAGSRASLARFVYAPAVPGAIDRELTGPATSLAFSAAGRAWLADPLGGVYLGLESDR